MFKRVLVSIDFSPATEALVSSLPGLAAFGTRELVLSHIVQHEGEFVSETISAMEDRRRRLRTLGERLEDEGFEVSVDVTSGAPAVEVSRLARERDVDLILVGTRSHSRMYEAFVGSVAWEIVRQARRPVLLQRIEASRPDPEAALESQASGLPARVVFATDFGPVAERASPLLDALAPLGIPSFTLLHVLSGEAPEARAAASSRLEEMALHLRERGALSVEVELHRGTPSDVVLNAGGRDPAALIVMGTRRLGVVPELMLGSQSRSVVREAAARVLLVPGSDAEE